MKNKIGKIVIAWLLVVCMIAPLLPDFGLVLAADVAADNNYDAMSMDEIFKAEKSLTWVFAGDSITQNDRWTQGMNGYAEWFEQYLYDIGRKDSVILSAWSGASISEFQPSSDGAIASDGKGLENMITKYNPDVVFIKMGMNDRDITTEEFTNYYKAMLDGIYAAGKAQEVPKIPKVVLLTPSPVSSENKYDDMHHTNPVAGANEVQDTTLHLQKAIKAIWEEYDATYNPIFCDLRTAFLDEALVLGDDYHRTFFGDSSDGHLHPNAAGQYFIFKTLCEALDIDTTSEDIFKFSYDDINSGTVYVDGTSGVDYENNYADTHETDDATEMAKDLSGKRLLASVDFDSANGVLETTKGVDLTDTTIMDDALNVNEAKSMGKEYSVVFRAKFNSDTSSCDAWQSVFSMNANSSYKWNNKNTSSLSVLFPAKSNGIFYSMKQKGTTMFTKETPSSISSKTATDFGAGKWHTYAFVQSATDLKIYIDGVAMIVQHNSVDYTLPVDISTLLADATEETFEAYLGDQGASETTHYRVDGSFDYWQLYNDALTEDEVEELSSVDDIKQINNSMQSLTDGSLTRLANVDFDNTDGVLDKTKSVNLTTLSGNNNPLTVDEAKSMGKEYSVVFRAKFNSDTSNCDAWQSVFSMNANFSYKWNNKNTSSLSVLFPAKSNGIFYSMKQKGTTMFTKETPSSISSKTATDFGAGKWHTYAFVQSATDLKIYIDSVAMVVQHNSTDYTLPVDISTLLADATEETFEAYLGDQGASETTHYRVDGSFDYWQLYNSALTAENVMTLTDAAELNCTMPTLSTALTQNVLASVQFTEENSVLGGSANKYIDLTDAEQVDDVLDWETEVKNMGKTYTVAFRAKLTDPSAGNQSVFSMGSSASGDTIWNSENIMLNIPGYNHGGYYQMRNTDGEVKSSFATFHDYAKYEGKVNKYMTKSSMVDEHWHTFVYVQDEEALTLYIDGHAYTMKQDAAGENDAYLNDTIGNTFANTGENFVAYLGKLPGEKDASYLVNGKFDYWTLYDGAFTEAQVQSITEVVETDTKTTTWSGTLTKNNVWAVAGAEQMSGYEGIVAERSLFRLLDNTMRYDPHRSTFHTDIRMVNASAPGYTVTDIAEQQNTIISNYSPNVYLLLPEVSEVYDTANYSDADHTTKVTTYANTINSIVDANQAAGITTILWTPLASDNETINNYLADYADAVRNIVQENSDVLFFDAYRFMNENMTNEVLKRNWFGNGLYISPLCALDLTYAFYTAMDETSILTNELTDHNLRFSTDKRIFGDDYAYDNISVSAEVVTGTQNVAIDVSNMDAVYSGATIQIAWVKDDGTEVALEPTQSGNIYTVAAPCNNPVFAVYGSHGGAKYRFNNVEVAITGVATDITPTEAKLTSLEVVGVPSLEFSADTISYDVQLYQYQKYVQVLATAQEGLTIAVNGEPVASGENSGLIDVTAAPSADLDEDPLKITVDVAISGSETKTTYTLNLTRELNPDIIITEVMQDGYTGATVSGNDNYELIEIYNASGEDLNLLNYSIGYKLDTPESNQSVNKGEWPYYFTGNNQAFSGKGTTYTGINQITNYSTYDENGAETASDRVDFPANSTMVIWVKFAPKNVSDEAAKSYMDSLTYDTLVSALEAHMESGETKTVPSKSQLVIAEIPMETETNSLSGATRVNKTAEDCTDNFYMENNSAYRSWMFLMKKTATQAANGAITEDGNDIISAAKFARVGSTDKLSSVLSYNTERGMSLVKNEAYWDDATTGEPHTSDQQGYSNATTFGAIEYWQKPANSKDTEQPVVLSTIDFENKADATANFTISDDTDIRYVEFYARKTGEETWTEVIKKDIVFEECVANTGVTADKTSYTFSYGLELAEDSTDSVEYYGLLVDGSGNVIEIGSEAEPVDSCKYELVKYTAEEVKGFIEGGDSSYPEDVEGYLFAGWYKNEEHKNINNAIVTSADVPDVGAYALYIPEHVLSVQAQLSTNLLDNDLSDDATGAIRFVTSVDSLNYNDAGFYFTFDGNETEYKRSNNKVHDKLYGIRQDKIDKEDWLEKYSPSTSFCARSSYFKTHAWVKITQSRFDLDITATPFVETLDGKIVKGEPVTKCINDGRGSEWTYVDSKNGDDANTGSKEAPVKTLETALAKAGDKGVVYVVGEYVMSAEFVWPESNNFVTITGDTLNCKAIQKGGSLNIRSAVRFDGITIELTDGMWIWANGNEVTIAENVTVNGIPQFLFGGGYGTTVESTDLTVLAGNYQMIIGGGYGTGHVVNGDTNLRVGGEVNADLDDTYERLIYGGGYHGAVNGNTNVTIEGHVNKGKTFSNEKAILYGGGRENCTVSGNTNVTVKGNAIFNYIYGGGHGSTVSGNTNVTVTENVNIDSASSGTANIVGGGIPFYHASNTAKNIAATVTGNTNITVGGNAKFNWIFGGARKDTKQTQESSVAGQTNVTIKGSTAINNIWGGGFQGTNSNTSVTVEGGTVNILVGAGYGQAMTGNTKVLIKGGTVNEVYGGSDSANVIGNTEVAVLGGKIMKQVYGGCKNSGTTPKATYSVTGHTSVKIGSDVDLAISTGDKAVYAVSRSSANATNEKGVFIINDYRNNANKFIAGSNTNATVSAIKSHHYFVNVSSGGDVSVHGDGQLAIKPNEGFKAIVKDEDGNVLEEYGTANTYALPTYDDEEIVLYVEFEDATPDTLYLAENGTDAEDYGTEEKPYATLNYALEQADNGDVISVVATTDDPYDVTSDSWEAHGKAVTITGSMMEFSTLGTLNIHDAVTFNNITLGFKNDAKLYANGYAVTMGENVVFNNQAYIYVYGAGQGTTVMDTNIKLLSGNYHMIYGAGNGGIVLGDTRLHIAGNVNENRDFTKSGASQVFGAGTGNAVVNGDTNVYVGGYANNKVDFVNSHHSSAIVYGASESSNGIVYGDTYVTIGEYAKVTRTYGGGFDGTVKGNTNIKVSGNVNEGLSHNAFGYSDEAKGSHLYGGGYVDTIEKNTYVTVEGNARFNAIYGGGRGAEGDNWGNENSSIVTGTTNVIVKGDVNAGLSYSTEEGIKRFAFIFGGAYIGTTGATNVNVTGNVNAYAIYGGGSHDLSITGDTKVVVNGNVNADLTIGNEDTSHSKVATVFGGSYQGTAGNTDVTIGDSAHLNYVFGGGSTSTSVAGDTSVTFNGTGARAYSIYGGSVSGTNTSTCVEMTAGWVAQVFGGCESATMTGDTNVRILGGTVTRRIYGGCYNNYTWVDPSNIFEGMEFKTSYYVDGYTSVTISPDVEILFDEDDNSVYATSRSGSQHNDEIGMFILSDYTNNDNTNLLGEKGFNALKSKSHHYLVNVSAGGNVYVVDGALKVVPDDGHTLASITYSDGTTPTTDSNGNYILPTKTDSVKTITVTFE